MYTHYITIICSDFGTLFDTYIYIGFLYILIFLAWQSSYD